MKKRREEEADPVAAWEEAGSEAQEEDSRHEITPKAEREQANTREKQKQSLRLCFPTKKKKKAAVAGGKEEKHSSRLLAEIARLRGTLLSVDLIHRSPRKKKNKKKEEEECKAHVEGERQKREETREWTEEWNKKKERTMSSHRKRRGVRTTKRKTERRLTAKRRRNWRHLCQAFGGIYGKRRDEEERDVEQARHGSA